MKETLERSAVQREQRERLESNHREDRATEERHWQTLGKERTVILL
jgi:hypothetical protein